MAYIVGGAYLFILLEAPLEEEAREVEFRFYLAVGKWESWGAEQFYAVGSCITRAT